MQARPVEYRTDGYGNRRREHSVCLAFVCEEDPDIITEVYLDATEAQTLLTDLLEIKETRGFATGIVGMNGEMDLGF